MTTDELRARLDDPALAIVDTRPLHLFNGWRADRRRARRPHPRRDRVPGGVGAASSTTPTSATCS